MPNGRRDEPPDPAANAGFYDSTYGRFHENLYSEIRRLTWGEDIGQNSWTSAAEQDGFIRRLALGEGDRLLDIACGSGGPTLRIAAQTGAAVLGVDAHADGITAARRQAAVSGLADAAAFEVVDASGALPFVDESFDAVMCIDAINHLPDRPRVLADWARVLKRGGRLLFTDPVVVTGPVTSAEIAIRASLGFFLFVAPETNDRMLADAGLRLDAKEDLTEALALTAARWLAARQKHEAELRQIEGEAAFEAQQRFFAVAADLAAERRLSRFAYFASKADAPTARPRSAPPPRGRSPRNE